MCHSSVDACGLLQSGAIGDREEGRRTSLFHEYGRAEESSNNMFFGRLGLLK